MSEVHIIAVLYPKAAKLDRVSQETLNSLQYKIEMYQLMFAKFKELMKWMCETVHSKEDYTLRYMMTEQLNADTPTYIMIETYAILLTHVISGLRTKSDTQADTRTRLAQISILPRRISKSCSKSSRTRTCLRRTLGLCSLLASVDSILITS
jgi:hypothetical protein